MSNCLLKLVKQVKEHLLTLCVVSGFDTETSVENHLKVLDVWLDKVVLSGALNFILFGQEVKFERFFIWIFLNPAFNLSINLSEHFPC